MSQWIAVAALVVALALSALLVSAYTFIYAQRLFRKAAAAAEQAREECAASVRGLQSSLGGMATELRESPHRFAIEPLPALARPSMNLTRRSQALRLRRKGESPQSIADSLAIPRQEVDLLLKVHEIVLNNFLPPPPGATPPVASGPPRAEPLPEAFSPAPSSAWAEAPPGPE